MNRKREDGFTLIELIIVIALIGILATIVVPNMRQTPMRAKEAVLKTDLHTFRDVIDQFFADRGYYPESLDDLVAKGYLRAVPEDPITKSKNSWITVMADEGGQQDTDLTGQGRAGIYDVHSGAPGTATDGTSYYDW
ncbi:MAG TPA: type II secretion system protein [Candidatus Saccharimonadales bacterium]|nr:type II secretion system protein [Candidatus Saccharimonadales bacterium]